MKDNTASWTCGVLEMRLLANARALFAEMRATDIICVGLLVQAL